MDQAFNPAAVARNVRPMARAMMAAGLLIAAAGPPAAAAARVETTNAAFAGATPAAEPYVYVAQMRYPPGYGAKVDVSPWSGPGTPPDTGSGEPPKGNGTAGGAGLPAPKPAPKDTRTGR